MGKIASKKVVEELKLVKNVVAHLGIGNHGDSSTKL